MTDAGETARTIVGIIGNVISFFLFASPAPTFWRILKMKSTEEFKPHPYLATVLNCSFWIFYGLPIVHPNSTLVVTINGIGLAVEIAYLTIFFIYTKNKTRLTMVMWLFMELLILTGIAAITLLVFHTHQRRSDFVGAFCVVCGAAMYTSPLTIMRKVITTKSVEFMPFYISLASFLNGVIWVTYALIKFDLYITIGNGLGAISGAAQLILYASYYKSTPKVSSKNIQAEKKPKGVQLCTPTSAPQLPV